MPNLTEKERKAMIIARGYGYIVAPHKEIHGNVLNNLVNKGMLKRDPKNPKRYLVTDKGNYSPFARKPRT